MSKHYIPNPKAPAFTCRKQAGGTPRCVYFHLYISTRFGVCGLLPFGFLLGPILEVDDDAPPPWSIHVVGNEQLRGTMKHFKDGGWFCIDSFTPGDVDGVATRLKRRILYRRGRLRTVPESVVLTIWSRQGLGLSETSMQVRSTLSIQTAETVLNPRLNRRFNVHRPSSLAGWLVDRNFRNPLVRLANDIWGRKRGGAAGKRAFFRSEPVRTPVRFARCSRVKHGPLASRPTPSLRYSSSARPTDASAPRTPSKRIPPNRISSERTTSKRTQQKWTSPGRPTEISAPRTPSERIPPNRITSERTTSVRTPPKWTLPWRKPTASQPTASQPTASQPTAPQPTPLPGSQAQVSWAPTTQSSPPRPSWFLPAGLLSDSPPGLAPQRPRARSVRSIWVPRSDPKWAFDDKGQMISRHECGCESPGEPCSQHKGSPHFTLPPLTPLGQSWRENPSWFEGLGCDRNGLPYRKNGD